MSVMDDAGYDATCDPINSETETAELDVMKDFVDSDSSSPSSPGDDPFDLHSSDSEHNHDNPHRKKFILASHITIVEDSSPPCYRCEVCNSYFSHKHTGRNHEFCGTGKKPFRCALCDKRFVKKTDRENHYKTHTGEKPFMCSVCGKSFHLRHKLLRHIRSHSGVKGTFQCPSCSRSFICREALRKHQVNKHNPNMSIQCKNCEKSFQKTEERQKHKCTRPQAKKKLVCEICGKTFSKNWNLTVHLKIHVGQRPFKCSICKKSFRLRHHLDRHSTKHQTDADFECMLCKQTFRRKDNMIRHLKLNHPDRHLGIGIKEMVQKSEEAKIAKSKKPKGAIEQSEAAPQKMLHILPVNNFPNIRFAKLPSNDQHALGDVKLPLPEFDTPHPSRVNSPLPGPSQLGPFVSYTKNTVMSQSVIKSGASTVLRTTIATYRFVQKTVIEPVNPFKENNMKAINQPSPQCSVLVFRNPTPVQSKESRPNVCTASDVNRNVGLSDDIRGNPVIGETEMESSRGQQGSVLRFNPRYST